LCPMCKTEMTTVPCPGCGFEPGYLPELKELEVLGGKVVEVDSLPLSERAKAAFYLQLLWYARRYGKRDGWAAYLYRDKFGDWPPWKWRKFEPIEPGREVLRYIERWQKLRRKMDPMPEGWVRRRL
ncbi:MAG: hypothetical protein N2557_08050, partial [Hydrogenophilus sp.]|nr:hypothetical protein [Hydrogenophilus sp.]